MGRMKGISLAFTIVASIAIFQPDRLVAQGMGFVPITPCRMVDTRTDSSGGPIGGIVRNLVLTGAAYSGFSGGNPCTAGTGIPNTDKPQAILLNFTMVGAGGPADLRVAPWGTAPTSSIMNSTGPTIANAAVEEVQPGGGGYGISVKSGGAPFNLIVDVLGYYLDIGFNAGAVLGGYNNGTGSGLFGGSFQGDGVSGRTDDNSGTHAGVNGSSTLGGYGVYGSSVGNYGVYGVSDTSRGVDGESTSGRGVYGHSVSNTAVYGTTDDSTGTFAGVSGHGDSGAYGVYGHSVGGVAVYAAGDFAATGTKSFVEPHPTDPTKEIKFVSLEGPESGTYFRGTGHIVNGFATIEVPEAFRMVTSEKGLTVQLTPGGDLAILGYKTLSLDRIVVQGSKDVAFSYTVNGVRKAFENFDPIAENKDFVPASLHDPYFTSALPTESIARLKANGILKANGSINEETAHRLGWDKKPSWNRGSEGKSDVEK